MTPLYRLLLEDVGFMYTPGLCIYVSEGVVLSEITVRFLQDAARLARENYMKEN
jgi:hypothetical protein